jgi:enterochelin esterase-like enzyme
MIQKILLLCALTGTGVFGQAPQRIKSPEISTDGHLTVRLRAPNAKEVFLTGVGQRLAMQKDDQGVWSATTDVLKPDVYMYQFSVDGMTVNDPSNPSLATSYGSGGRSVVTVAGPVAWSPVAGVAKGTVSRHPYHSEVVGDDREYFVYTPAGYDPKRAEAYPVLYLLHGLGDDAQSWLTQGNANVILDNLIAR